MGVKRDVGRDKTGPSRVAGDQADMGHEQAETRSRHDKTSNRAGRAMPGPATLEIAGGVSFGPGLL